MPISKIIFQTSPKAQDQYVINMIKEKAIGWDYQHFTDKTIIQFFINNPLDEFPFILNVFQRLKFGAHKADLFRYYFLYINGGIFIDSDAIIEQPIENIVQDNEFFSVNSYIEGTIFQGFIGCSPKNPIIYEALKDAYMIDVENLTQNYHLLTANMYSIIKNGTFNFNFKLYKELESDGEKAVTVNDEGETILIHYWRDKVIPNKLVNNNIPEGLPTYPVFNIKVNI
jgi:mannosyltransferase OCH1-like enzyme